MCCYNKNVQLWLFSLGEAYNFLNDPSMSIFGKVFIEYIHHIHTAPFFGQLDRFVQVDPMHA